MDLAYKRQAQSELSIQREIEAGPRGLVWEVRSLNHLDIIHEAVGNSVVVVLAYSRSCGSCKLVLREYQQMSTAVCPQLGCRKAHCCGHGLLRHCFIVRQVTHVMHPRHISNEFLRSIQLQSEF